MNNYFLIDYENVNSAGIKNIPGIGQGDTVIVFYSQNCKNVTLDVFNNIEKLNLKFSSKKVNAGTKNALDFQLSSFLGYLISEEKEKSKYHIVTNDNGYEAVAKFWSAENYDVDCIKINTQKKAAAPAKATAKKAKKEKLPVTMASFDEVKQCIGKKNDPKAVTEIFNRCQTKQEIQSELARYFGDSNKANKIHQKLKPLYKKRNRA